MRSILKRLAAALTVFVLAAAAGCGTPDAAPDGEKDSAAVQVVATIFPLADIARSVGGERVEVTTLLPAGASPHTFEPTPRQMAQVAEADVLITVGAGLDDWAAGLAAVARPDAVLLEVTAGMPLRQTSHGTAADAGRAHGDGDAHAHGRHVHGSGDPHVWLDPLLVRDEIAPRICAALSEAAPGEKDYLAANLEAFQEELTALDAELAARLERLEKRSFVAYHSAWGYFADRYGLTEAAHVEESPGKEPTPDWIATVVELAREQGAGAVFAEPQFSTQAAEVIAAECGGRVLLLDPLGGEDLPGRDSYAALMRYNAGILEDGLGRPE